jgi:hypothetical protein
MINEGELPSSRSTRITCIGTYSEYLGDSITSKDREGSSPQVLESQQAKVHHRKSETDA